MDVLGRTHRITLLVVPPEATEATGHQAMVLASASDTIDDPTQLLLLSGVRSSSPTADAPHTSSDAAALAAEDMDGRWDNDGGHVYERL